MDIFVLLYFGPWFAVPTILMVLLLQWRKLLPGGIPKRLYICLFFGLSFGSFWFAKRMEPALEEPARFQREHLGQIYGTLRNLERFEESGFQDPVVEWTYVLETGQAALLRKRCRWSEGFNGSPPRCYLYDHNDGRTLEFIELREDRLVLAKWDVT